jgi:hypothetical protein
MVIDTGFELSSPVSLTQTDARPHPEGESVATNAKRSSPSPPLGRLTRLLVAGPCIQRADQNARCGHQAGYDPKQTYSQDRP